MYGRTPISELPELEDLDFGVGEYRDRPNLNSMNPNMNPNMNRDFKESGPLPDVNKFVRNPFKMSVDSGMMGSGMAASGMAASGGGMGMPRIIPDRGMPDRMIDRIDPRSDPRSIEQEEEYSPPKMKIYNSENKDPLSFNCRDIATHIENCPICSRFYNNDKTAYIIAIVVLCIVCLLLLKRVLNV